ncbi:hypothetical protein T4C_1464 [Trichinella pseudospiralis]|uniref:Uncharacterized protein n=1 Tax=Trichinella pseudospiralis TaxID=6337 RepID=A0A0V1JYU1_TRIPS|nr:hypothetical protein T4C_1464 [Trichinella pseudospiralis]
MANSCVRKSCEAIQPFRSRIQSRQEEDKAEETLNKFWELDSISILCQQENYDTGCGVFTNCALAEHKVSEINPATLRANFLEIFVLAVDLKGIPIRVG